MSVQHSRQLTVIGILLVAAVIAFEIFNYDTTHFALSTLLRDRGFGPVTWAMLLAVAFCGIDSAGLLHLFLPHTSGSRQWVWYLFGAWLLGASLNAVLTWYAVGLTLVELEIGNEILSRQQLLEWVPVFIAALVWLTRILFIGALSQMGAVLLPTIQSNNRPAAGTIRRRVSAPEREQRSLTPASIREVPPRPIFNPRAPRPYWETDEDDELESSPERDSMESATAFPVTRNRRTV